MIPLFKINNYVVDTASFTHSLHGDVVTDFEKMFADYVGAKYACSVSSATNAIFLSMLQKNQTVKIPSMIPPVVLNALINSGNRIRFTDNADWVGDSYCMHQFENYKIIDSAQKVDKDQFIKEANDEDLMIFSFYPTKPVGSLDGGMIVSNDISKIDRLREATLNGMSYSRENWEREIKFPGWKMYMSSFQAFVGIENLKMLDEKKISLSYVRNFYNTELGYSNSSDHLYRINVKNRSDFITHMKNKGISYGLHYDAMHRHSVYKDFMENSKHEEFHNTNLISKSTISIPFNECLTEDQLVFIVSTIKKSECLINENTR